jgi:hypothetical protein
MTYLIGDSVRIKQPGEFEDLRGKIIDPLEAKEDAGLILGIFADRKDGTHWVRIPLIISPLIFATEFLELYDEVP